MSECARVKKTKKQIHNCFPIYYNQFAITINDKCVRVCQSYE